MTQKVTIFGLLMQISYHPELSKFAQSGHTARDQISLCVCCLQAKSKLNAFIVAQNNNLRGMSYRHLFALWLLHKVI